MVNVLVADDEVPIRQWLEFCINKMEGYHVVGSASNGAEGYSIFRKTNPDVIITDIRMPVMDGLEMLKMIRNLNPAVYAAVLTSHEDFEYARQAIKLGASEYILKIEITEESLRQVLANGRQAARVEMADGRERQFEDITNRNYYLRSLVLSKQDIQVSDAMLREYRIPLVKGEFVALDSMMDEDGPLRLELPEGEGLEHVIKVPLELKHTILLGNVSRDLGVSSSRQMSGLYQ